MNQHILYLSVLLSTSTLVQAYESQDDAEDRQERQISRYAAQGIHIRSFTLLPSMAFNNEYDSNIFKRDKNQEFSSYIAHFQPGFMLASNWNQHQFNVALATDIAVYSTQGAQNNYEDVSLTFDGRVDILRHSQLEAAFAYQYLHEDRGSPDQLGGSKPTLYDQKLITLAYKHQFNRFRLKPAIQFSRTDYQDTLSLNGLLQQSSRSRWEYAPSIRLGYEIQPEYETFAQFTWQQVDYDTSVISGTSATSFQRNSSGYNILAGMEFDLTELLTGDISIGYQYRRYADARLASISGVNGFANLMWRPTPLSSISLAFRRTINETTQNGVSGFVATSPSIKLEHELLRNLILSLGVYYRLHEYKGFDVNNTTLANRKNRLEHIVGTNFGVKYLLNRNFNLSVNYNYDSREVNYVNTDYEVHKIMFNITAQL